MDDAPSHPSLPRPPIRPARAALAPAHPDPPCSRRARGLRASRLNPDACSNAPVAAHRAPTAVAAGAPRRGAPPRHTLAARAPLPPQQRPRPTPSSPPPGWRSTWRCAPRAPPRAAISPPERTRPQLCGQPAGRGARRTPATPTRNPLPPQDVSVLDARGRVDTVTVSPGVEKSSYVACYDDYLEGHVPVGGCLGVGMGWVGRRGGGGERRGGSRATMTNWRATSR
jgi:hypothetical protein